MKCSDFVFLCKVAREILADAYEGVTKYGAATAVQYPSILQFILWCYVGAYHMVGPRYPRYPRYQVPSTWYRGLKRIRKKSQWCGFTATCTGRTPFCLNLENKYFQRNMHRVGACKCQHQHIFKLPIPGTSVPGTGTLVPVPRYRYRAIPWFIDRIGTYWVVRFKIYQS